MKPSTLLVDVFLKVGKHFFILLFAVVLFADFSHLKKTFWSFFTGERILQETKQEDFAFVNPDGLLAQTVSLQVILLGKFDPAKMQGFSKVPAEMSLQRDMYLQNEVVSALKKLQALAKKSSFNIYIVSATRSYWHQKNIWQAKYLGKRRTGGVLLSPDMPEQQKVMTILRYSSMPGTSRHHWGTDFDLFFKTSGVRLENSEFEKGEGLRFYNWLVKTAPQLGFCQPYKNSPHNRRSGYTLGYFPEKWHWSFKPLSKPLTEFAEKNIDKLLPQGFDGVTQGKKVYYQYILNIHPDCL